MSIKIKPHFLQSSDWASARESIGHKALWLGDNLIFVRDIPGGMRVGYAQKLDLNRLDIEELKALAREYNLLFIHIDPVNLSDEEIPKLIKSQFTLSENILHKYTLLIDLTQPLEDIMNSMKPKTRYNIRLGENYDVKVRFTTSPSDFQIFIDLFFSTVKRQKYYGRNEEYYTNIWKVLVARGKAVLAIAEYDNKPLTAWMLFLGENGVYYPYGGSSELHREVMSNQVIVWEIIKWAKEKEYQFLDLWGTDPDMPGVRRFKQGFGGINIEYANSIDIIFRPIHYKLFKIVNRLRWIALRLLKLF